MFSTDSVSATSNPTIRLGEVHATNPFSVSAEQLAAVWNRPLAEIRQRLSRLGERPSNKDLDKFGRWVMGNGMTPAAKAQCHTNYEDEK